MLRPSNFIDGNPTVDNFDPSRRGALKEVSMRLKEIYRKLVILRAMPTWRLEPVVVAEKHHFAVIQRDNAMKRLYVMREIPGMEARAKAAIESIDSVVTHDRVVVLKDTMASIVRQLSELDAIPALLIPMIEAAHPSVRETSTAISVRLPEADSLSEVSDYLHKLSIALDQPCQRLLKERVTFAGVDTGSAWIEIGLASLPVLSFLTNLIKSGVELRKARKSRDQTAALVDIATSLKSVSEKQAVLIEELIEDKRRQRDRENEMFGLLARKFAQDAVDSARSTDGEVDADPETLTVIATSIETIESFLAKGGDFQLASTAPPEARAILPDGAQRAIETPTPLLGPGPNGAASPNKE